jgi:magnesium-transporting ATPase (P-type)
MLDNQAAASAKPTTSAPPPATADWHARSAEQALAALKASRAEGLSGAEAERRAAVYGKNILPPPQRRGPLLRFLLQFHNLLIYVLLGAALVTALLGDLVDTGVIVGVVLINALIGFIQEGKAEHALDAIGKMLPFNAQVLRDGRRIELPAQQLVPGDIVFLASGDKVPADLRLIDARSLRIEEAALTGESLPADKQTQPVDAGAGLGDRSCMAFSSTLVRQGTGTGVVVGTASATEIGRISAMLAGVEALTTPLLLKLAEFGRWLTVAILGLAALMFAFGTLLRGYSATDMFSAAVGLAVAAIPEGLPAIMTITLAIGVQGMARRNAIIRRLPAVEALGSVTVICTDKTGTLTRNEMTVRRVITAQRVLEVTGAGYAPQGSFTEEGAEVDAAADGPLTEIARIALLCNDAELRLADGQWELSGDPTEGALLSLALKAGLDSRFEHEALPRHDVIPFESEHRFMATLHHDHAGRHYVFLKGAPEQVIRLCSRQRAQGSDRALEPGHWERQSGVAAAQGMRLLAVAMRSAPQRLNELAFDSVLDGEFTLLGVLGLADPPREEAMAAVARCRAAGIRVKMITGDHEATARAIGEQLGLADGVTTIKGEALETMDDAQLDQVAMSTDIFARASPQHKLRLVEALQRCAEVVVMTGDGVNDAPALKRANVGVAMGRKGTEAAKEAAEMVLSDDNFASIAAAVEEGRTVYDNIRKAIVFILPTNGGEAGMLLVAVLLGLTLPITPVQILWVNLITEVTLSLVLAFEKPEPDVMARPPRDPAEPMLNSFLVWRIGFVTVLLVSGGIGLFMWELDQGASLQAARTVAVNALVMGQIAYLFNVRRFSESALSLKGLTGNRYVLLAVGVLVLFQALFTYLPAMHSLFGTAALDLPAIARVAGFGLVIFLAVETEKWLRRPRLVARR